MERQQLEALERKQEELNQKRRDFDDMMKKKNLYDEVFLNFIVKNYDEKRK